MITKTGSVTNVGPGKSGHLQVSLGNKVMACILRGDSVALPANVDLKDDIDEIRAVLNTTEFMRVTGAQLDMMLKYLGITRDPKQIKLPFADQTGINVASIRTGGVDTGKGVDSFDVEIDFAAGAEADMTLKAYLDLAAPDVHPGTSKVVGLNYITGYRRHVIPASGAGQYPFRPAFGKSMPHEKIKRIWAFGSNVSSFGVKKNGNFVHEDIPQAVNDEYCKDWGRTPVADLYVVDFTIRGDMREGLAKGNGTDSMEFRVNTDAAGDIVVLEEVLTLINWM